MNHEYLIDTEGRRWCADDCPREMPHWSGEPESVYRIAEAEGRRRGQLRRSDEMRRDSTPG